MGRRGIAQLVTLWALLLLGTLAGAFAAGMRTEAQAARNGLDGARAYYQARTGVNRAIALLASGVADNTARLDLSGEEGDASYAVTIERESGKIDINLVSEQLLKEILGKGGLSEEEAERMGDAILDWRDDDGRPRTHGAEELDYASLPEPVRPRNGRLARLDELLSVRGVTPEIYRRFLSRVFTAHGNAAQVDVNGAPLEALRVLPGLTPEAAEALDRRRKDRPFANPAEVVLALAQAGVPVSGASLLTTAPSTRVFTVTSRGSAGQTVVRTVRCLVDFGHTGGGKILRWEDQLFEEPALTGGEGG